ncbi:hypothetical protein C1646_821855 [Rhizophagus diaphanus]|nr:hypothetical protein C1646_821855 [Rhizophagus diaphanus] [Rhizophagus sp. MUCL 43196]
MSNFTFPTCNALSLSQTEMDGERNLQRNLFNGSKLRRTVSLQYVFPSFQVPFKDDKNTQVYDDNINYGVGLVSLSIYEEFSSKQKEDKEAQNKKVYEAKENQSQTDNCSIIQSINSEKTQSQKTYGQVSAEDRSSQFLFTYPFTKSGSGSDGKARALGLCQLLRNERMDSLESSKTQYSNSDSYYRRSRWNGEVSLPKLQDIPERLAKTFGITEIFPLYLDRSEYIIWFLNEDKSLHMWNDMENSLIYMGSDLEEGVKNHLIHPDKLCYVIEDTHERIPINEEERHLDEEFKNHMEEIGFEKMLLEAKANIMASKEEKARKKLIIKEQRECLSVKVCQYASKELDIGHTSVDLSTPLL